MIVTILGGSAGSTPWLVVDWLASHEPTAGITIRLAGRSEDRLAAVARASRILAVHGPIQHPSIHIEAFEQDRWDEALQKADVVLVQVRIGGLEAREFDETFSLPYGVPGDEGLGPGGLSAALRSWPGIRQILIRIERNAPKCLPVLLTSPGSLLVRLAAREFPGFPLYAICELPFTTLREVCRASRTPVEQALFSYAGVNHLGWFYQISHGGADLIANYSEQQKQSAFYPLMKQRNAVPLKYFHLHLNPAGSAAEQLRGAACSRARQLGAIHRQSLDAFESGSAQDIRVALGRRPAPWYTEAIGPLLLQLSAGRPSSWPDRPFFLSAADSDGAVSERAYRFDGQTFRALPAANVPKWLSEINNSYVEYERLAAIGVEEPDPKKLEAALRVHPWITRENLSRDQVRPLAEKLYRSLRLFGHAQDEATCRI